MGVSREELKRELEVFKNKLKKIELLIPLAESIEAHIETFQAEKGEVDLMAEKAFISGVLGKMLAHENITVVPHSKNYNSLASILKEAYRFGYRIEIALVSVIEGGHVVISSNQKPLKKTVTFSEDTRRDDGLAMSINSLTKKRAEWVSFLHELKIKLAIPFVSLSRLKLTGDLIQPYTQLLKSIEHDVTHNETITPEKLMEFAASGIDFLKVASKRLMIAGKLEQVPSIYCDMKFLRSKLESIQGKIVKPVAPDDAERLRMIELQGDLISCKKKLFSLSIRSGSNARREILAIASEIEQALPEIKSYIHDDKVDGFVIYEAMARGLIEKAEQKITPASTQLMGLSQPHNLSVSSANLFSGNVSGKGEAEADHDESPKPKPKG